MFGSDEIKALERRMGQAEKAIGDVAKGVTDLANAAKDLGKRIDDHKEHCCQFFAGYNKDFDRYDDLFKEIQKAIKGYGGRINYLEAQVKKLSK